MTALPKPRVLVAEDIRAISVRIAHQLREIGCEVQTAGDGEESLALIHAFQPDLVLLDLMMPKLNGIEVLKRLRSREETRDLPVIACTAKDFNTELKQVTELGVVDVIIKPFDHATLIEKVAGFFQKRPVENAVAARALRTAPEEVYAPTVAADAPHVTLWGTRGSIPVSGPSHVRYGGNTSCMEFSFGDQRLIFDAGSGLREASASFHAGGPRHLHLFITHTHWDHIQGFPFFTPIYTPGWEITVYGERGFGKDFKALLSGQLDRDYFPVQVEDLQSKLTFRYLDDDPVEIGDIKVTREFTNHPGATVAFKIEAGGRQIVFCPDNEFLQGYTGAPGKITRASEMVVTQEPLVDFLTGVDLLIHEAQYLPGEYPRRIGWGHSNLANACALAALANVRKWLVVHHDPSHDDAFLDRKLGLTRHILREIGYKGEVAHGYDGMVEWL